MRIVNHILKVISSLFVKIHILLINVLFLRMNSFSVINKSQKINLDIPSLKGQLPESSIGFFNSYKSPLYKIYNCPKSCISLLGVLSSNGFVLPYNLPVENLAQSIILISAYKKIISLKNPNEFKEGSYILFFNPFSYSNIAHWLTEALVRIWICRDIIKINDQFLIPKSNMTEFAIESIRALGFQNDCLIHDSSRVIFQQIKVINSSGRQSEFDPCLPEIRETILAKTNNLTFASKESYILYVKRHEKSNRKILNEEEVLESLKSQFEVKVIEPSQMSFDQQVREFSETRYVISMHGAALANIIWMKRGAHVVELYKDLRNYYENIYGPPKTPSSWYSRLSAVMSLEYHLFQCIPSSSQLKNVDNTLIVDCKKLSKLLKKIFI